jgi:MscS family membrane protein
MALGTRDTVRDNVIDELSSAGVWIMMAGFCLEAMSLEFGFALGSVFAVGGIGSASAILALRSTMENFIGGLLLKIQDKFRVGEKISLPGFNKKTELEEGFVEEISFIQTTIRRLDNTIVTVPNHSFTQNQIINWSRTPFRLFKSSINVPLANSKAVPDIVADVEKGLKGLPGVEMKERELLVSASALKDGKLAIEVVVHLRASDDVQEAKLRTEVVRVIAEICSHYGTSSTSSK